MFELTQNGVHSLRCKICTLEKGGRGQQNLHISGTPEGVLQSNNPVQAKGAAQGITMRCSKSELRRSSTTRSTIELLRSSETARYILYPELRYACSGLLLCLSPSAI
jgi:hypothetical protein